MNLELLCFKCVLTDCDEDSPQCLYKIQSTRLSRKAKMARMRIAIEKVRKDLEKLEKRYASMKPDKKAYDRERYQFRKLLGSHISAD